MANLCTFVPTAQLLSTGLSTWHISNMTRNVVANLKDKEATMGIKSIRATMLQIIHCSKIFRRALSTQNSELLVTAARRFMVYFILMQSKQLTGSGFTQILFLPQSEDCKFSRFPHGKQAFPKCHKTLRCAGLALHGCNNCLNLIVLVA